MKFSFGAIKIGTRAGDEASSDTPVPGMPFRIAVLGDFSGRASRGTNEPGRIGTLRPILVDRDNFEDVMARLGVGLHLNVGGDDRIAMTFKELDDFRPDRLFHQVEVFEKLRQTRKRLSNSATFAEAAAEVSSWSRPAAPAPAPAPVDEPAAGPQPAPQDLLDEILKVTSERRESAPAPVGDVDWNSFLKKIVSAHATLREDPRQPEWIAQVDAATSGLMRSLLHHADFQALEAAWRGLYFLVRQLETDGGLKLYLLDVSRAELANDLVSAEDLGATGTYRLLVEQTMGTPGAPLWSVLAGQYSFAATREDAELLGRLATIAHGAGAPFLGAACPSLLGCTSLAATPDPDQWTQAIDASAREAWEALRQLPEATSAGLALPRFLLRLPYGKDTDPVEAFDFEEVPTGKDHDAYLWGNPSIACAFLLGQAFVLRGWGMKAGMVQDIDGLPIHVYRDEDGESAMKPCAEVVLGNRAADAILDRGLMPLLSYQGQDRVRLAAFRSLSSNSPGLAGRWGG